MSNVFQIDARLQNRIDYEEAQRAYPKYHASRYLAGSDSDNAWCSGYAARLAEEREKNQTKPSPSSRELFLESISLGLSSIQLRIRKWTVQCFGAELADNAQERNHRFVEEALELVQACGCTKEEALDAVEYVYARPVGEVSQELGGVMSTLLALATAHGLNVEECAEADLEACWEMIDKLRTKRGLKPKFGSLSFNAEQTNPA